MIPSNFTRIAKRKIEMQQDQGYVVTEATEDYVILKRIDKEYGSSRNNYQKVCPFGSFQNLQQSTTLVENIEAAEAVLAARLETCSHPEDAAIAYIQHTVEVRALVREYREDVINE